MQRSRWEVLEGDCIEAMQVMEPASVDAVVCDPPYGLEFMGKDWDRIGDVRQPGDDTFTDVDNPYGRSKVRMGGSAAYSDRGGQRRMQEWHEAWAREALRVLKPGGFLIAAGGSRTYHRLVCAIEDAGFEIRDCITHLYGSGFPKSLNVSEALRKLPPCTCDVSGKFGPVDAAGAIGAGRDVAIEAGPALGADEGFGHPTKCKACGGVRGQVLDGFGTALKPSAEFWTVARKPLSGTVAATVLEHGTGALNIDGCRVGTSGGTRGTVAPGGSPGVSFEGSASGAFNGNKQAEALDAGRWPANVVLSHHEDCRPVGTRRVKGDQRLTGAGRRGGGFADVGAASGDGEPNAPVYGDAEVEAFECVPDCPVRMLDEQTGEASYNPAGTFGRQRGDQPSDTAAAFAVRKDGDGVFGYGDKGGASRFYPCFGSAPRCMLCRCEYANTAEPSTSPSASQAASVPGDAPEQRPPKPAAKSDSSKSSAPPAESGGKPTPETIGDTAPTTAQTQLAARTVQLARSAVPLCDSCATAIAQSVARTLLDPAPESQAGPDSTLALKRQTLSRSLALVAAGWQSTGITPTTESLSALCGSALLATTESTTASDTASDGAQNLRLRYQSKASSRERNAGLDGFEERDTNKWNGGGIGERRRQAGQGVSRNVHPTVKPIALMRWLVRLVCPPGGVVLDCFAGSGSTGCATVLEGFDFVGIEREAEYVEVARVRIDYCTRHDPTQEPPAKGPKPIAGQLDMLGSP